MTIGTTTELNVVGILFRDIVSGRIMPDLWLLHLIILSLTRLNEHTLVKELWAFYDSNLGPTNTVEPGSRSNFVLLPSSISLLMLSAWKLRDSQFGSAVFHFYRLQKLPISGLLWRRYLRLLLLDEKHQDILAEWPYIRESAVRGEVPELDMRTFMLAARKLVRLNQYVLPTY